MTTLPDNPNAPGCFGSALTFSDTAPECRSCIFATQCQPLSESRRVALRAKFGIVERKHRVTKPQAPPVDDNLLSSTLPKKVAEIVQRLDKLGFRVLPALLRGENPFTTKPAFLRVTCHLLLHMPQGIDRHMLRHAFAKKLNWSEGTAAAHATQAFQILGALGATQEINGRLTIRSSQIT